jgi:hypothetical protein
LCSNAVTSSNYKVLNDRIISGGMTNIQLIFDLVPHCLSIFDVTIATVGFQVLKVIDLKLVDSVLHITPKEKIQWC